MRRSAQQEPLIRRQYHFGAPSAPNDVAVASAHRAVPSPGIASEGRAARSAPSGGIDSVDSNAVDQRMLHGFVGPRPAGRLGCSLRPDILNIWPMYVFLLLLLAVLPISVRAAPRPRVVLVLCDGLTVEDLRSPAYPHLNDLAVHGAVGLMNCAVAGPKTRLSAFLTMAVGDHAAAEPTDGDARNGWEPVEGEIGDAAAVYARRTGAAAGGPDAAARVWHLGIASLARRHLDVARLGAILAAARPPVRAAICGNSDAGQPSRAGALLTVDAVGVGNGVVAPLRPRPDVPFGIVDHPIELSQMAAESPADLVVVEMGDQARLEALRPPPPPARAQELRAAAMRRLNIFVYLLTGALERESRVADILLVSPRPMTGSAPGAMWDRLTPIVAVGPDFRAGLLTSATTRTPGLVANTDVGPTILNLFRLSAPPTMIGRPMRSASAAADGSERLAQIARMDFVAFLDAQGVTWITVPLGVVCFLLIVAGLVHFRRRGPLPASLAAAGAIFTLNLATGMLPAPLLIPPTLAEYGLRIAAWMAVLTVAAYLLARPLRISPAVASALIGLVLVGGDAITGQTLLKQSLLSGYAMSGIRYYGIGNEYLGIVLGFAILGGFAWLDDCGVPLPQGAGAGAGRRPRALLALTWALIAFVLAWPGLGANAGSLAATGAGFTVGAALLVGKRPTWRLAVAGTALGLAFAFLFGLIDAALAPRGAGNHASHIGAAIQGAAGGRGVAYLAAIAVRKVAMNLRLVVTPWLLLPAAAVAIVAMAARALVGDAIRSSLTRRPWTARGLSAVAAAATAALVFKDSGAVTVVFLAGAVCMILLYYVLTTSANPEKTSR